MAESPAWDASVRSPLEVEFDDQVRVLLARIEGQEDQARAAQPDDGRVLSWPPWSMDTGLSEAQELFVETWSPQQVLQDCRSVRQLVLVLQRSLRTHRDDADLDEALTILAALPHSTTTDSEARLRPLRRAQQR